MTWTEQFWSSLTLSNVLVGIGIFLGSLVISFVAIAIVMVNVPPTYFSIHHRRQFLAGRHWLVRSSLIVIKNLAGLVLVVLGIFLSFPGVPGQGILTILLGLIMLDIPGIRTIELLIIRQQRVLAAINALRSRYKKPPLVLD
jgi:hypothetical protein